MKTLLITGSVIFSQVAFASYSNTSCASPDASIQIVSGYPDTEKGRDLKGAELRLFQKIERGQEINRSEDYEIGKEFAVTLSKIRTILREKGVPMSSPARHFFSAVVTVKKLAGGSELFQALYPGVDVIETPVICEFVAY